MDPIALLLPVAGIGLILLVVWLTGGVRHARIADAEAARRQVALDWPEFRSEQVLLDRDGRAGLLIGAAGQYLAAVYAIGDRIASRLLAPADVRRCRLVQDDEVALELADLGAARIALRLADGAAAAACLQKLDAWRSGARP